MILFSDLHLKPESADVCFEVLDAVCALACASDRQVAFLGDFWHVRYALPVDLLNCVSDEMARWQLEGVEAHLLPGNHDQIDVLRVIYHSGFPLDSQTTCSLFSWILKCRRQQPTTSLLH
jgi:UDP-2,3-diacylglucosamine pyrophosphatase LpxH